MEFSERAETPSNQGLKIKSDTLLSDHRPQITETFRPCCVGHTFTHVDFLPDLSEYVVQDFLVDSSGLSKGGDQMEPLLQIGLNAARTIGYNILPGPCKKGFKVSLPGRITSGYFSIELGRFVTSGAEGGFYDQFPATLLFNGIEGPLPTISYNSFSITDGNNDAFKFRIQGSFTHGFSFKSMTIRGNYPARNVSPTFKWYKPHSNAAPFGLPTNDTTCFVLFGYDNPINVTYDLGPIIKLL